MLVTVFGCSIVFPPDTQYEDDSCKSSSDDDRSNLYTYAKGAQAQPTGKITTDSVEGQFQVWLSTSEGYNSMHLRADVMAMKNLAEVNTA